MKWIVRINGGRRIQMKASLSASKVEVMLTLKEVKSKDEPLSLKDVQKAISQFKVSKDTTELEDYLTLPFLLPASPSYISIEELSLAIEAQLNPKKTMKKFCDVRIRDNSFFQCVYVDPKLLELITVKFSVSLAQRVCRVYQLKIDVYGKLLRLSWSFLSHTTLEQLSAFIDKVE